METVKLVSLGWTGKTGPTNKRPPHVSHRDPKSPPTVQQSKRYAKAKSKRIRAHASRKINQQCQK
jgi:hypothetical protein